MISLSPPLSLVIALLLTAPASFFAGRYEIIGRSRGTAGRDYSGWAEVTIDGENLSIVRRVGGKKSHGSLESAEASGDRIRVLRTRFILASPHDATSDLPNSEIVLLARSYV